MSSPETWTLSVKPQIELKNAKNTSSRNLRKPRAYQIILTMQCLWMEHMKNLLSGGRAHSTDDHQIKNVRVK